MKRIFLLCILAMMAKLSKASELDPLHLIKSRICDDQQKVDENNSSEKETKFKSDEIKLFKNGLNKRIYDFNFKTKLQTLSSDIQNAASIIRSSENHNFSLMYKDAVRLEILEGFLNEKPYTPRFLNRVFGKSSEHSIKALKPLEVHLKGIVFHIKKEISERHPLLTRNVQCPLNGKSAKMRLFQCLLQDQERINLHEDFLNSYTDFLKSGSILEIVENRSLLNRFVKKLLSDSNLSRSITLPEFYLIPETLRSPILDTASQFEKEASELNSFLKKQKSVEFVEDFPYLTQNYFLRDNLEVDDFDKMVLCKTPYGRTTKKDREVYAAALGYSTFLIGGFFYTPLLGVSALSHSLRFASEIKTELDALKIYSVLGMNDSNYYKKRIIGIVAKLAVIAGSNFAISTVGPALKGQSLLSLVGPNAAIGSPEFIGYVYGNLLTNVFFAVGLMRQKINPLSRITYYTDTIGNFVLYSQLTKISKALGYGNVPLLQGFSVIPVASLMIAIEDIGQTVAYLADRQYLPNGRGQEYFGYVVPTLGLASIYLYVIQVPVLKSLFGEGTLSLISAHVANIVRSTVIQLPGYDIAGEMFSNPDLTYFEALQVSFQKYSPF